MKTLPLPQCCCRFGLLAAMAMGLCLAISTAAAADQSVTKTPPVKKAKVKAEKAKKVKTEKMVVTGSRLPQEITPGGINATAVPVDIVTSDTIRRMGATSVAFVLSRQPGFR